MRSVKRTDIIVALCSLAFAVWFFGKSLGYDPKAGSLWVARNQVGDFGLHLSLVRSFSWGHNFPPQSPFYPGVPLTYHYLFDLAAGLIARSGVRTDIAVNGLSVVALTVLLYSVYRFAQDIFGEDRRFGIVAAFLFLSPGGWGFLDFFRSVPPDAWVRRWWRLPDYLHSGPFDGSVYSTYFTLNVWLNQRHLVAACAVSLVLLRVIYRWCVRKSVAPWFSYAALGFALGALAWLHSLVFVATAAVSCTLFAAFRRWKAAWYVLGSTAVIALPRLWTVYGVSVHHSWWHPGFLMQPPYTFASWIQYWWQNAGIMLLLIPVGVVLSTPRQRIVFWCIVSVFAAANILQFSFRIEHNHSLLNYFFLIGNIYGAVAIERLRKTGIPGAVGAGALLIIVGMNGLMQFPAIKNDYRFVTPDSSARALLSWIERSTPERSIFLAPEALMDPVTLAGRFTYVGPTYYLSVMGYDPDGRRAVMKSFLEHPDDRSVRIMREQGVSYVVIPRVSVPDYPYRPDLTFFASHAQVVFTDAIYSVYRL